MLHQKSKVQYAVLHAPWLIEDYKKPPYNKVITNSILRKLLNRSCGIEIECFGSLWYTLCSNENCAYFSTISSLYNVMDYAEDRPGVTDDISSMFNEHKIRIKNYTQLQGLYDILNDMKTYCKLNMGSGIHIHIDISDVYEVIADKDELLHLFQGTLTPKLDEIEKIFYPHGEYEGTYNHKRVGIWKDNWVAVRGDKRSLEFRIAPMTFDYTTIVTWLVKLNRLVNWCILQDKFLATKCNVRSKVHSIVEPYHEHIIEEDQGDKDECEVEYIYPSLDLPQLCTAANTICTSFRDMLSEQLVRIQNNVII
jgi:hypothetical protein